MSSQYVRDLTVWFPEAKRQQAQYLVVVCDTFDYEWYPVYVKTSDELKQALQRYNQNMQKVEDVFDVKKELRIN